ncbi:MAG: T9SS type A sorting domain-containing protein, partial [Ferruginibacter sp.]|nr:T9SS type A sorting domain-containing protein [Ferruginibacter sp.]
HAYNASNTADLTRMNAATNTNDGTGNYGNDGENMQFIDIDLNAATKNSSSANLVLPAGINTIKYARLYWGGRFDTTGIVNVADTLRKVKLRFGTATSYNNINAPITNVDQSIVQLSGVNTSQKIYQAYTDITDFVNANKGGTYTIADVPATTGTIANGGFFSGWAIVVVYENLSEPYNSVRIFDGFAKVAAGTGTSSLSINLTGLDVPNTTLASGDAVMGAMVWEGDANLGSTSTNPPGDFIKINNIAVSNSLNAVANFWNGSITKNGVRVSAKNPDYNNQMGIDIDEVNVGTGYNILPNATTINVQFGTEADTYFPSLFTFNVRAKQGSLPLNLSSISAKWENENTSLISWNTDYEAGTSFFEIERSQDGSQFQSRGKVKSRGDAHHYQFSDPVKSNASVYYYRLRMVDADGAYSYSPVETLKKTEWINTKKIIAYPNPFLSDVKIVCNSMALSNATIKIYSQDGKNIFIKNTSLVKGKNIISIHEINALKKGTYIVEVRTDNEYWIEMLIKN